MGDLDGLWGFADKQQSILPIPGRSLYLGSACLIERSGCAAKVRNSNFKVLSHKEENKIKV
jgi:hypothetical protein